MARQNFQVMIRGLWRDFEDRNRRPPKFCSLVSRNFTNVQIHSCTVRVSWVECTFLVSSRHTPFECSTTRYKNQICYYLLNTKISQSQTFLSGHTTFYFFKCTTTPPTIIATSITFRIAPFSLVAHFTDPQRLYLFRSSQPFPMWRHLWKLKRSSS